MRIKTVGLLHNSEELSTNLAGLSTFSYFFAVFIKNSIFITLISYHHVLYDLHIVNVEKLSIPVVDIWATGGSMMENAENLSTGIVENKKIILNLALETGGYPHLMWIT